MKHQQHPTLNRPRRPRKVVDGKLFIDHVNVRGGDGSIQTRKRRCLTYLQVGIDTSTVLLKKGVGHNPSAQSKAALPEFKLCCFDRYAELNKKAASTLASVSCEEQHTPSLARRVTIEPRSSPPVGAVDDPKFLRCKKLCSPVKSNRSGVAGYDLWAFSEKAPAPALRSLQKLAEIESLPYPGTPRVIPVKVKAPTKRRGNRSVKRAISLNLKRAATL